MTKRATKSDLVPTRYQVVPGTKRNDLVPGSPPFRAGGTGNQEQVSLRDSVPKSKNGNQVVARGTPGVRGNSNDPARGAWVTPDSYEYPIASAVGPFDFDPFSNPRSHIVSTERCMLEDGGDGFGDGKTPGSYRSGRGPLKNAGEACRVWLQPPYLKGFVQRAFRHYRHTRWVALLRFDPRPPWWQEVYDASELVAVVEIEFEPPPGVKDMGGNSFPHALYYRRAEDVTPAVLRLAAAVWRKKPRT